MDYTSTYMGVLLALLATGLGFPVPEEIILMMAGAAAGEGPLDVRLLLLMGWAGVLGSDAWVYFVGRHWGSKLLRKRFFHILLPPARIERAERRFHGHSWWAILTVRFIFGLKAPTFFTAGLLRLPFGRFLLADTIAACVHVPLYLYLGYFFSGSVADVVAILMRADRWVAVTVILGVLMFAGYLGYALGVRRKPVNGTGRKVSVLPGAQQPMNDAAVEDSTAAAPDDGHSTEGKP